MKKNWKKSHNAEKTERRTLWDFSTSILSENIKKIEGDTFWWNFFSKNVSQSRKYSKGENFLAPLSFLDDLKILRKLLKK